ncbi:MAG TPA: PIG-L family deacetylase [Devosia sp.]|jgi:LmbE family N-acetylglucosaminyl deacetylase|uniref:PIG-L family deacetylase n=1 Tax=Devosia sp. TaxID=1871048 RepID=UPI002DDD7567|nr:PIG-L family deacetylase [Devosia sp.]HEV2515429.1 PIG-L family deacetylase [Devosia sp.]
MLTARERLARQKSRPLLVELYRALSRLTSTLTVMNTGAHPDDEHSGMLAALRFGLGMRVVIACSTRGEGGQNSLGAERGGALGVLRSREMEEAARTLDADVAWLGFGPDDSVHDFGFSKNGADTLARWGRDRTIARLAAAYRQYRPDIVIPTFLDVPGQHGHHRAMTEAAEAALALAADATFSTPGLLPWSVAKYYLPAWSGGGDTYDDEVPPPDATVEVRAPGRDTVTGASFSAIGEWSRAYHATQGMGRWTMDPTTRWPLHLRHGPAGSETDIRANLPATLADLARLMPERAAVALHAAQDQIASAMRAFPDRPLISTALVAAARAIETARTSAGDEPLRTHGHRLERKLLEIDAALLLAEGINPIAWAEPHRLHAGDSAVLRVQLEGDTIPVTATATAGDGIGIGAPDKHGASLTFALATTPTAPLSDQFLPGFASLGGNGQVRIAIAATIEGRAATTMLDLEEPLTIAPSHTCLLQPSTVIVNRASPVAGAIEIKLAGIASATSLALQSPTGWRVDRTSSGFAVTPPADLQPGRYHLPVLVDGHPAFSDQAIAYPHIGRTHFVSPLALNVLALDLELPANTSIGYVGGGSDRVGYWLKAIGLDVTELDDAALAGDLSRFTSIVIGTFAFGQRPALRQHLKKLHAWVASGGHLLTLYHRPSDGWDPQATPPRPVRIGSPSLRWRVTDPAAEVSTLLANSPLLLQPNIIGADDWSGWDKERGLYFAAEWDPAYQALLAMNDVGEAPLHGALISAEIGAGRHTHTSLVLHHQLDKLVPGAFRLMANLVQPASNASREET